MIPHFCVGGAGASQAFSGLLGRLSQTSPCVVLTRQRIVPGSEGIFIRDMDVSRVHTHRGVVPMQLAHLITHAYRAYNPGAPPAIASRLADAVARVTAGADFAGDFLGPYLRVRCSLVGDGIESTLDACVEYNRDARRPEISCEVDISGSLHEMTPATAKSAILTGDARVTSIFVFVDERLPITGGWFQSLGLVPAVSLADVCSYAALRLAIGKDVAIPTRLDAVSNDDLWLVAMDRCGLMDRYRLVARDGSLDAVLSVIGDDPELSTDLRAAFLGSSPFPDPWAGTLVLDADHCASGKVALVLSLLCDAQSAQVTGSQGVAKYVFVDESLDARDDIVIQDAWMHLLRVGRKLGITVIQMLSSTPDRVMSLVGPRVQASDGLSSVILETGTESVDILPWIESSDLVRGESVLMGHSQNRKIPRT